MSGDLSTTTDRQELVDHAYHVEGQLVRSAAAIRTAGVVFAKYVHEYLEERLWEVLEYDSAREGLAHPGIEVSYEHAKNLSLVYRTFALERNVPIDELKGLDLRKLQCAIPAVTDGKVTWQDAVSDAKALSRSDMQAKYDGKRPPNAKLDATQEPERVRCPTCEQWTTADKVEAA